MSLLNPPPPPPPLNPWVLRIAIAAAIAIVLAGGFYYAFRHRPHVQTVERFMDALVAGDYRQAYEIWQPSDSYTYQRFLLDWGKPSEWGEIREYEIVGVQGSGGKTFSVPDPVTGKRSTITVGGNFSGVLVGVRINRRLEPIYVWVENSDLSLSFPPF